MLIAYFQTNSTANKQKLKSSVHSFGSAIFPFLKQFGNTNTDTVITKSLIREKRKENRLKSEREEEYQKNFC